MARFVSKHRNYSHGVRGNRQERLGHDGKMIPSLRALEAKFSPDLITDEEVALGEQSFTHTGLPEDRDTEMLYSPRSRLSVFDSQVASVQLDWTEDEEALVVKTLRESDRNGLEFIEVGVTLPSEPWKGYDEQGLQKIIEIARALDSAEEAIAYEKRTQNRSYLIEELERVTPTENDAVILEA